MQTFKASSSTTTASQLTQRASHSDWLQANCPRFIANNHWPPNSLDLKPLDYHVWSAMLEQYHRLQLKPKTIDELKVALQTVWEELPQEHINKVVANFTKRLTACVADNGHFFTACSVKDASFGMFVCRQLAERHCVGEVKTWPAIGSTRWYHWCRETAGRGTVAVWRCQLQHSRMGMYNIR